MLSNDLLIIHIGFYIWTDDLQYNIDLYNIETTLLLF